MDISKQKSWVLEGERERERERERAGGASLQCASGPEGGALWWKEEEEEDATAVDSRRGDGTLEVTSTRTTEGTRMLAPWPRPRHRR